jgi:hypothetical protein
MERARKKRIELIFSIRFNSGFTMVSPEGLEPSTR